VDHVGDLADRPLEDAVRGGVRDHQRREPVRVLVGLSAEVVEVHVPVGVALHDDHLHPGHHGARGVGPVRARSG
jgi:hypothetical protein